MNLKTNIILYLKGLAMGCADLIPGVSGGTIALISGIYKEFIGTLNGLNFKLIKVLFSFKLKEFWQLANGKFILPLFAGIATSIILLAKLVHYILYNYALLLWGFFSGLILYSVFVLASYVKKFFSLKNLILFIVGLALALVLNLLSPVEPPESLLYIYISGAIAICAMILPGISGSFVLLLLGSYKIVVSSIADFNFKILIVFSLGAITGLLLFSKLLNFIFTKYENSSFAILSGFLLGSLVKIWPWKRIVEYRLNSKGKEVPFIQENVLPSEYSGDPLLLLVVVCFFIGMLAIFLLNRTAKNT